jgi:uncharacterized protein (TIGR02996 family)
MTAPTFTEEWVYRIAPDGQAARDGQELAQNPAFDRPRRAPAGTWLDWRCRDYTVCADLSDPDRPVLYCNCLSRKRPCKHSLALLFLAARTPERFREEEPPAQLRQLPHQVTAWEAYTVSQPLPRSQAKPAAPPTHTGESLLRDIGEHPEDDAPRLIYADWLQEQGEPLGQAHAEFIRLQVARHRAAGAAGEPGERERKLLERHRKDWLAEVPANLRKKIHFVRGFPEVVELMLPALVKHAETLFRVLPTANRLCLRNCVLDRFQAGRIAVLPALSRVRGVELDDVFVVSYPALEVLLRTPFLSNLREFRFAGKPLRARGAEILGASPVLPRLERLELVGCELGGVGLRSLLAADTGNLRVLDLGQNNLGNAVATGLVASPVLGRLRELGLAGTEVGPSGAKALAGSPQVAALERLSLAGCPIGDVGARALAESPHLAKLHSLDLAGVELKEAMREVLRERFGSRVVL